MGEQKHKRESGPKFSWSDYSASEARQGNPWPLISRMHGSAALSEDELKLVVEALEATAGKRGADLIRRTEAALIALQIEDLMAGGMKVQAAADLIAEERGRSRRHVYYAIATAKRNYGRI